MVLLVEVSRLPQQTREPQLLWLWCRLPAIPNLALVWRAYVSRVDLEHTFHFLKQTLNWTLPRPRHPQQAVTGITLRLGCSVSQKRGEIAKESYPHVALAVTY
jgi:hypothetical protein